MPIKYSGKQFEIYFMMKITHLFFLTKIRFIKKIGNYIHIFTRKLIKNDFYFEFFTLVSVVLDFVLAYFGEYRQQL